MIGLAKESEGLYYLEVEVNQEKQNFIIYCYRYGLMVNALPSSTLWHLRLGHLSHDRKRLLNRKYN